MEDVIVKIMKLREDAVIPQAAIVGDACLDLTAVDISNTPKYIQYHTGLAAEIPRGYVMLLFPRSSVSNTDLSLANCVGVIDPDYRGEIILRFKRINQECMPGKQAQAYKIGDRVGQFLVLPIPQIIIRHVSKLTETVRGSGGFGHTD